jgi:DNA-directed RNA polymerase specialized sigma subunit
MFPNFQEIFLRRKKIILTLVIVFLLFGVIALGIQCYFLLNQQKALEKELKNQETNEKIVSFLDLFIEKVLQSDQEISFEERLKLENGVRDLDDSEILSLWETFTQATTADEVQTYCKNLLEALVKKIL